MKETLEKLLAYFEKKNCPSCQCGNCIAAREWILMIKKELENDSNPQT